MSLLVEPVDQTLVRLQSQAIITETIVVDGIPVDATGFMVIGGSVAQTVTGVKTFTSAPVIDATGAPGSVTGLTSDGNLIVASDAAAGFSIFNSLAVGFLGTGGIVGSAYLGHKDNMNATDHAARITATQTWLSATTDIRLLVGGLSADTRVLSDGTSTTLNHPTAVTVEVNDVSQLSFDGTTAAFQGTTQLVQPLSAKASGVDVGVAGQVSWDGAAIYVCTVTGTGGGGGTSVWVSAALA